MQLGSEMMMVSSIDKSQHVVGRAHCQLASSPGDSSESIKRSDRLTLVDLSSHDPHAKVPV